MEVFDTALASLESVVRETAASLPRVLLAIVVLLLGWIVAKLIRRGSIKAFRIIHVDEAADKAGIEDFLLKGGVRFTTVTLLAELIYWFLFFATVFLAMEILGLEASQTLIRRIVFYVPNVMIAVIILIFGSLISQFVKALVNTYLNNVGIKSARTVGTMAQGAIWIFVLFVTLEQLAIDKTLLLSAFQIGFGGLAIAFGISFGLGGQEVAKKIAEKLYKSLDS